MFLKAVRDILQLITKNSKLYSCPDTTQIPANKESREMGDSMIYKTESSFSLN